jgi:phosphoribosyl 1,2-cyclic phosphodiesterase
VGNNNSAILIDVGIPCKQVEERLQRLNLSSKLIRGIIVTHEHSDHIKGVEALAVKFDLPVYITATTLQHARLKIPQRLLRLFSCGDNILIDELKVFTFAKQHDAIDPCSIVVEYNNIRFGVFTDIGEPCKSLIDYFKSCHAALLESNYDEALLRSGNYPFFLKRRISGINGHLSNRQALELFLSHRSVQMSHLFLAHLSQQNNCPKIVEELFTANAAGVKIVVASRHQESEVFTISPATQESIPLITTLLRKKLLVSQLQFVFE